MAKQHTFRVALVSMKHRDGDVELNLAQHRRWLERALAKSPDFVGFPEFALTGWVYDPSQMLTLSSPEIKEVESWACEHGVHIATCFVEKRGGRYYNATLVTGPRGRIGVMRKVNLVSSEGEHYTAGRQFPVFDLGGCKMGVATCADATRYEMIHLLSLRGAEMVFAPHANSLGAYGNCRDGWVQWRMERWPLFAQDSCCYIAGVSCAGLFARRPRNEAETKFCAGAMVMDWKGRPVKRLTGQHKKEGLLIADLDLAALREVRERHSLSREFRPAIVYNRREGWVLGRLDKSLSRNARS